jgi:hypothetical protein
MTKPDITRPHGHPQLTPAQMDELAQHVDGASAVSLYTSRYEQGFLRRGDSPAEARSKAEWWAQLKVNPPAGMEVIDPDLTVDDMLDRYRAEKVRGEPLADPSAITAAASGIRVAAAGGGSTGRPPVMMERPRNRFLTGAFEIDRFSLNPGRDSVLQQLNEADLVGPAPEMFNTGPLPIMTGSGAQPAELRWVAWQLRHTAAFATSRAHVLELIEASQEPDPDGFYSLQSEIGKTHLDVYFGRIQTWASTLPDGDSLQNLTPAEIARFYPAGPDDSA